MRRDVSVIAYRCPFLLLFFVLEAFAWFVILALSWRWAYSMNWSQKVGGCGDASGVRNALRGTADVTLWIRGCNAGLERVPGVETLAL
jgi:hypothetical protein